MSNPLETKDTIYLNTLQINKGFSNEDLNLRLNGKTIKKSEPSLLVSKWVGALEFPEPFELVEDPNGGICKLAYGKLFDGEVLDYDIELYFLKRYEYLLRKARDTNISSRVAYREKIKYHYKRIVSHFDPRIAAGWNRWSEDILNLFISEKIHHVLWGSGNCGKSIIMALLLYIKWRINPSQRMIVIASKVAKDSQARVFAYIKEIHGKAPPDPRHEIDVKDSDNEKGIYVLMEDRTTGKKIKNDRACIVLLPIKTNVKAGEIGGNLLGKHPDDLLVLAFDESQEIIGDILTMKIFLNWYTNTNLEIHAWGNPTPIDYHAKETWDLLYTLGAGFLSVATIKQYEKRSDKTDRWGNKDTDVLRLTMLDSPKDDAEEQYNLVMGPDGIEKNRLHFIAGSDTIIRIAEKTSPHSPAWYSQVLGFPYVDVEGDRHQGIFSPHGIRETRKYPLIWKNERELVWYMGVDPSLTGHRDDCSIVCGRSGLMLDGRDGIDLMNGEFCRVVKPVEGMEFADVTIEVMYALSRQLGIPLENIGIEVHGTGEVFRYALQNHIENGKWANDIAKGQGYHIISPTIMPTSRLLFKGLGRMFPAKEMVTDIMTEYAVAVRCAVLNRQIFNIPDNICQQFYNRELQYSANKTKYKVETKAAMYKRGVRSPSLADSLCNLVEVIRSRGKFKYKFYNTAGYNPVLGEAYESHKKQNQILNRMGIISEMLNIDLNLGLKNNKMKGAFDLDSI